MMTGNKASEMYIMKDQDTPMTHQGCRAELVPIQMPFAVGAVVLLTHPSWWSKPDDAEFTVTEIIRGVFGSGFGARVTPAIQENHPDKCDVFYDTDHFRLRVKE
jgi:hypothetical protein